MINDSAESSGMLESPLVSIVTPSLNMGRFLEETIRSVLEQDYRNLEYLVVDGGSTDNTLELLHRFAAQDSRFRFVSQPDQGASSALVKGFERSQGEIFAYLNADDLYFPGAIRQAVHYLRENPGVAGVYGGAHWISEDGEYLGAYPTSQFDAELLTKECYICQPATFLRSQAVQEAGGFNPSLHVVFDYDLWLRMARLRPFVRVDAWLAKSRMHRSNKTLRQRTTGFREAIGCVKRICGYVPFQWVHGYSSYLIDRRDQFFEPLRPTFTKYALSLALGTLINWSSPLRFWKEWASVMSVGGFVRRWNATWVARRLGIHIR